MPLIVSFRSCIAMTLLSWLISLILFFFILTLFYLVGFHHWIGHYFSIKIWFHFLWKLLKFLNWSELFRCGIILKSVPIEFGSRILSRMLSRLKEILLFSYLIGSSIRWSTNVRWKMRKLHVWRENRIRWRCKLQLLWWWRTKRRYLLEIDLLLNRRGILMAWYFLNRSIRRIGHIILHVQLLDIRWQK